MGDRDGRRRETIVYFDYVHLGLFLGRRQRERDMKASRLKNKVFEVDPLNVM
jgi:hypothetical protein